PGSRRVATAGGPGTGRRLPAPRPGRGPATTGSGRRRPRRRSSARAGRSPCRTGSAATTRPRCGRGTTADGKGCSGRRRSPRPPREKRLEPVGRARELVLLDGSRRVYVLGARLRALAHEGALPHAVVLGEDLQPLPRSLVTGVHVVALGEGDGRGADEAGLQAVDGAGGVAQQAVDAHAELLVGVELVGGLPVLALSERLLLLPDDPGLHLLELPHEVGD